MSEDTVTQLHGLLAEARRAHAEAGERLDRLERLVLVLTGEDPLTGEVALASEGLRDLLRRLLAHGGRAEYGVLLSEIGCSPQSLGQRRARSPLGKRLIAETRVPGGDFVYSLRDEDIPAITKGLSG